MGIGDLINDVNNIQDQLNKVNPIKDPIGNYKSDGFLIPATYQADGNGLPYNNVRSGRDSRIKRNIITWFIPEFGVVKMYVNPTTISYGHKKLIFKDRTKGGYTLQYWGEELSTLNISGTTGSSGVEGMNVLYEIYRAEQYAFDSLGLTLASESAAATLANNLVNSAGGALGSFFSGGSDIGSTLGSGLLGGILGLESQSNTLSSKTIPSLAQLAFTVEMYYSGWVYRGYFENMTINEKANDFLLDYQMSFVVTQRRGYRVNSFPFNRSAKDGPSNWTTPHSFSGRVSG
jgi:hypothetical protein